MIKRKPEGSHEGKDRLSPAEYPVDFEFRHHLHDTIILLGGKKEIADLLIASQDYAVKESDVDELRKYNITLIEQTKDKLASINRMKIRTKPK